MMSQHVKVIYYQVTSASPAYLSRNNQHRILIAHKPDKYSVLSRYQDINGKPVIIVPGTGGRWRRQYTTYIKAGGGEEEKEGTKEVSLCPGISRRTGIYQRGGLRDRGVSQGVLRGPSGQLPSGACVYPHCYRLSDRAAKTDKR